MDRTAGQDLLEGLEALHADGYGWALCCTGRDPELAANALQEAYLRVLDGRARFAGRSGLRTWFFAVVRRTAAEELRRRGSWLRWIRPDGLERPEPVEPPPAFDDGAAGLVLQALAGLPRRQRQVLHLVFYQELSVADAAVVLGVSLGAARRHYERGKARLRACERLKVLHVG